VRIAIALGDDVLADGAYEDCAQLCAALATHGHDVTAYVRRQDQQSPDVAAAQGYRTVSVCAGPPAPVSPPAALPYVGDWAAKLASLWAAEPPDIVHTHGWLGGLAAQLAARAKGLPTVQSFFGLAPTTAPGLDFGDTERARLEPLLARNATWVTGGSNDEVDALAKLRHNRARLSVLPTGVDVERYSPVGPHLLDDGHYRIVCLGLNPLLDNGFDRMVRALPRLPGTELVIAETAPPDARHDKERAGLMTLAAKLGVRDRIRFMGTVAADELPALLRSADVVACTPRQSPRATAALAAMASGVVVVAVDVGALTDTVVQSVTGMVVSANNPNELITALKALQAQGFQRQSMGAAGRSRAASRFTWHRIALDALHIYQQANSLPRPINAAQPPQPTSGQLASKRPSGPRGERRVLLR